MEEKPRKQPAGLRKRVTILQIPGYFGTEKIREKISAAAKRAAGPFRNLEPEKKERYTRLAVSLVLVAGITLGSIATVAASARYATVAVNGKEKQAVEIDSTDTTRILNQAGVSAGADDIVLRTDEKSGNVDIAVLTAKHVFVETDGKTECVLMHFGDTVSEALAKAGVAPDANDLVSENGSAGVADGMKIVVTRRCSVNIEADGKTVGAVVGEGSVSRALSEAGVALGPEDTTDVAAGAAVTEGMTIRVGRVTYKEITATQPVAFPTVTKKDNSMAAGAKAVKAEGQNGLKTIVTRQKLCNGNIVQTSVVKTEITKQPVAKVVAVGTKTLGSAYASVRSDGTLVDQNGSTVSYRKVYTGRCSAYSCGTYTSTGQRARFGLVAVNPSIIPYGSRLYICSPSGKVVYGYAVAADTGGAALSGRIVADLYYPSESQCEDFGCRTMNVYVLN